MAKRYVTNDTPNMMYVEGRMIAPGEGREVDAPDEAPALVEEPMEDPELALAELLDGNVAGVVAALDGLSRETLNRLQELEAAGKNRKGVLEGLADAFIALADAKLKSDDLSDGDEAAALAAAVAGTDTPPAE